MAKAKNGCLGWIIIAGAIIAWLSGGHEDQRGVTSVPIVIAPSTMSSTGIASRPAPEVAAKPASEPTATRDASSSIASRTPAEPHAPLPNPIMSATANVRLRSSEAANASILTTIRKGTAVEVIGTVGDRVHVNVPSLNVVGWVHKSYLVESTSAAQSPSALAETAETSLKPKASTPKATPRPATPTPGTPIRDPFYGSCDCPYDYARNGSRCGGRSAYSRPGGREPICYYE